MLNWARERVDKEAAAERAAGNRRRTAERDLEAIQRNFTHGTEIPRATLKRLEASEEPITVKTIIQEYLTVHGYGGLYNEDRDEERACCCFAPSLFPCGEGRYCKPGYKKSCNSCADFDCKNRGDGGAGCVKGEQEG